MHRRRHPADAVERGGPFSHCGLQSIVKTWIVHQTITHMRETKVYVSRFVVLGAAHELCGWLVGGMTLDEAQQVKKRSLAQNRQEKGRLGEIFCLHQREQRSRSRHR